MYVIKKNKKGNWIIIKKGAKRATKVFDTKAQAIAYAELNYSNNYEIDDSIINLVPKKSRKKVLLGLLIVLLLVVVVFGVLYFTGIIKPYLPGFMVENDNNQNSNETDDNKETDDNETLKPIVSSDFQVHFLELGNYNAGDCTYIKAGDIDILIDAGSRESSVPVIKNYINQYCTDGILEYVIVTHADQDHIVGFTDQNSSNPGIFSSYEVEVIIDFAMTNKNTAVYNNYIALRDKEISQGAKHYTALDCINQTNGASKKFQLTEDIYFEVLNQEFYSNKSSDENNYSVCTLFNHNDEYFLFTGDLEEAGEESLVELNPNLPKVKLFKGGHHGSKTSSNECLLELIQPEIVCVCCCAGSSEYTKNTDNMFPTQDFINRISKYTDRIYVTTQVEFTIEIDEKTGEEYMKAVSSKFKSLNGNIVVTSNKDGVNVLCSNDNRVLKDTDWFNMEITLNGVTRKMRTWPSYGV